MVHCIGCILLGVLLGITLPIIISVVLFNTK